MPGVLAWTSSLLAAAMYVAPNNWMGAGDLPMMAVWSLPFAFVISVAAAAMVAGLKIMAPRWFYFCALLLGPVLGLAFFAIMAATRGGWVVAFPVFSCWAFGGTIGLLLVAGSAGGRKSWILALSLAVVASVLLLWTHATLRQLN